jgi:hypothetical protein
VSLWWGWQLLRSPQSQVKTTISNSSLSIRVKRRGREWRWRRKGSMRYICNSRWLLLNSRKPKQLKVKLEKEGEGVHNLINKLKLK